MQHFKDFLIKIQTLGIKINTQKLVVNGQNQEVTYYDISHENPLLSPAFNNELKELKELAITDILNLSRAQVILQLQRLHDVKELFHRFWERYYRTEIPNANQDSLELVLRLNLNDIFISPRLMFFDHAIANDDLIYDLEETIRYREQVLIDFEKAVSKIIDLNNTTEKIPASSSAKKEIKANPAFREEIIPELYSLLKNYFSASDQHRLMNLLRSIDSIAEPLVFIGKGNQLADAFRQLFDANLIAGCNKAELQNWILVHFLYREKGMQKHFNERYLQDMISSNTKSCQSPLFDIRRSDGRLYLFELTRINKK